MTVKRQKTMIFVDNCGCIVDHDLLSRAILWFDSRPQQSHKSIYIHGRYPAVSIFKTKIHVHRLLGMYLNRTKITKSIIVHHKDGNRLNASAENLELVSEAVHGHMHNFGKTLSLEHRAKISIANRKRLGARIAKRVPMPDLKDLITKGFSINSIAKHYGCDWSTVKNRIYENPELLIPSNTSNK